MCRNQTCRGELLQGRPSIVMIRITYFRKDSGYIHCRLFVIFDYRFPCGGYYYSGFLIVYLFCNTYVGANAC